MSYLIYCYQDSQELSTQVFLLDIAHSKHLPYIAMNRLERVRRVWNFIVDWTYVNDDLCKLHCTSTELMLPQYGGNWHGE